MRQFESKRLEKKGNIHQNFGYQNNNRQSTEEARVPTPIYPASLFTGKTDDSRRFSEFQQEEENSRTNYSQGQIFPYSFDDDIIASRQFSEIEPDKRVATTWDDERVFNQRLTNLQLFESTKLSTDFPYPSKLKITLKLDHTLIIEWLPAVSRGKRCMVGEYHVIVNGRLETINPTIKTKAVVEDVYDDKGPYVIGVCYANEFGRSDPSNCVITYISDKQPFSIKDLHLEYVSIDHARIAWIPYNSDVAHDVQIHELLNEDYTNKNVFGGRSVLTVPAPFYRYVIDNLIPGIHYEVVVSQANIRDTSTKVSSNVLRFVTPNLSPPYSPRKIQVKFLDSGYTVITWNYPSKISEKVNLQDSDVKEDQAIGFEIQINGTMLYVSHSSTIYQYQVSTLSFAKKVISVLKSDKSYEHRSFGFLRGLPTASITMRTLAIGKCSSDTSEPFILSKLSVANLLKLAESNDEDLDEKQKVLEDKNSVNAESNTWGSKSSESVNKATSVAVPAIEITQDTSSEDEYDYILAPDLHSRMFDQDKFTKTSFQNRRWYVGQPRPGNEIVTDFRNNTHNELPYWSCQSDEQSSLSSETGSFSTPDSKSWKASKNKKLSRASKTSVISVLPKQNPIFLSQREKKLEFRRPSEESTCSSRSHKTKDSVFISESMESQPFSYVVALYDYIPSIMSPNEDFDKELPFREGEVLRIYGDMDGDGFYLGEARDGEHGLIPSNMISHPQDDNLQEGSERKECYNKIPSVQQFNDFAAHEKESTSKKVAGSMTPEFTNKILNNPSVAHYRALYDYNPSQTSPNSDSHNELQFQRGDIINIFGQCDEDGYYWAELQGRYGLVPSNFVQSVDEVESEKEIKSTSDNHIAKKISTTTMTDSSFLLDSKSKSNKRNMNSTPECKTELKQEKREKLGVVSRGRKLLKFFRGSFKVKK